MADDEVIEPILEAMFALLEGMLDRAAAAPAEPAALQISIRAIGADAVALQALCSAAEAVLSDNT